MQFNLHVCEYVCCVWKVCNIYIYMCTIYIYNIYVYTNIYVEEIFLNFFFKFLINKRFNRKKYIYIYLHIINISKIFIYIQNVFMHESMCIYSNMNSHV